jgi:hypothetical protein
METRNHAKILMFVALMCVRPGDGFAEKWVEFHAESWSHVSQKLRKQIRCSSTSYYDAASIKQDVNGDVSVLTRDVSRNDRYYVGKGTPEKEVVYKQVLLRCRARKYEVLLGDDGDTETQETVSEEIRSGSVYEKLYLRVCTQSP